MEDASSTDSNASSGAWDNRTVYEAGDYPDFTQIPAVCVTFIVLYFAVMTLALSGNLMVCYIIFSNRKMHTVVNYYIVNLAVCDFMVGAFVLPVKLLELTGPSSWGALNDGLCTAMSYLQTIFVFASVLTLVATCLERYFAILHPLESRMQQSKARAKKILLAVWLTPCTVALPFLYPSFAEENVLSSHYGTIRRLTCFIDLPEYFRMGYYTFLFIFIYLVPLTFIGGTCIRIARCLVRGISFHRQGSLRRQENNRRKVAKMIMVVVVAYGVSWTPYFVVTIVTQYQSVNFLQTQNYFFTMLCINLFAFFNSCVNPFIYAAMSSRFRNGFKKILLCYDSHSFPPGSRGKTKHRTGACPGGGSHKCSGFNRQAFALNEVTPNTSDSPSQSESGSVQQTALNMGSFRSIRSLVGCIAIRRKSLLDNCRMGNGICGTGKCSLSTVQVKIPEHNSVKKLPPCLEAKIRAPNKAPSLNASLVCLPNSRRAEKDRVGSEGAVLSPPEESSADRVMPRSRSWYDPDYRPRYQSERRSLFEKLLRSKMLGPLRQGRSMVSEARKKPEPFPCKIQTEFSVINVSEGAQKVQCSTLKRTHLPRSFSAPSTLLFSTPMNKIVENTE